MFALTEREKVAHLLRRFGLGASEAEVDYYGKNGLRGAIDQLFAYEKVEEAFTQEFTDFIPAGLPPRMPQLQSWWGIKLVTTRRPLVEKMVLFWHNHFATSAMKVDSPFAMLAQNNIFRESGLGSFRDLLLAVSTDPAMLFWLDNQDNVAGKPNENFAREIMELFTLGIGHYTEKDIQEAARAFTGWTFGRGPLKNAAGFPKGSKYRFVPELHDDGVKTFHGQTGKFHGEDIIDLLCSMPRTAEFITRKMWTWFAYADPSEALVKRLTDKFVASKLDIGVLVRSIMEAPEFYSEQCYGRMVKSPVDYVVSSLRSLGLGSTLSEMSGNLEDAGARRRFGPAVAANGSMKAMGMELFYPPDVSGWAIGLSWISSATMVERIKWASKLFDQRAPGAAVRYPAVGIFELGSSPAQAARTLAGILDARLPESKMKQLEEAARAAAMDQPVSARNANTIAYSVAKLLFGTPEFQFQ